MKRALFLFFVFAVGTAFADQSYSVKPGSTITYLLIHKLHEVEGTAKDVEGKAILAANGKVLVQVRAKVESFDSGNGNRDAHMKEATDATRFPYVEVKAASANGVVAKPAGTVQVPIKGKITFHGVEQPFDATLTVTFTDPRHANVTGTFPVSLEAHKVERPSLLMVKVSDAVKIVPKLVLEADK